MHSITRPLFFSFLILSKPSQIIHRIPTTHLSTMSSSSSQVDASFLQNTLSSILSAPHISFPKPPAGLPNLRLGHGPVDLFSTRFANTFAGDAKGVVAGKEVDKEGLKEALLALQKTWQSDSVKFEDQQTSVSNAAEGDQLVRCSPGHVYWAVLISPLAFHCVHLDTSSNDRLRYRKGICDVSLCQL